MFNKYIRYFNQNRKKIIKIIIVIVCIFSIIQLANYLAKLNLEYKANNINNNTSNDMEKESIISDSTLSDTTATENNNAIDEFVQYCNDGDIDGAYNMLSNDCKSAIYSTEDSFKSTYYEKIFKAKKSYDKENWISADSKTTYLVKYYNDILAYGGYNENETFEDYITVITEDRDTKLNISNFIGKEEIDKSYEDDNIKVSIASKYVFMNYETYSITFINKANEKINLDNSNGSSQWYVVDSNSDKYYAAMSEITDNLLIVEAGKSQVLSVKFNRTYNPKKTIKQIEFNDIILNEEKLEVEIKF